jgi:predicted metalloprotease with PDZ domain
MIRRWLAGSALLAALLVASTARAEVEYRVDLSERAGHRLVVQMIVRGAPSPLDLSMPAWTPGAYELRTWGRNLTPLEASDGNGRPLAFTRTGASGFRVEGHAAGAEVRLRYRVYAPLLSDDSSQVDAAHAYLNGSSLYLRARGADGGLHRVRVAVPEGWKAGSGLDESPGGAGEDAREAIGYEKLIDAPTELGRFASSELRAAGRIYQIAVDGAGEVPAPLLADVRALAEAESRMVGTPPYRRYFLLIHLDDGIGRMAALEHAASTSIVVPRRCLQPSSTNLDYDELLYVIAHELFHAWNARRLRPAELVPYDLTKPQPARSLWITEGLTEYYAHRAMHLSGRWSRARYLDRLSDEALRAVTASRRGLTLEEDAELAWQPPDESAGDPDAYYARGHLVALGLDAAVRQATGGGRSLDDVMRALLAQADRKSGMLPIDGSVLAKQIEELAGPQAASSVAAWTQRSGETERLGPVLQALGLKLSVDESRPRTVAGFVVESEDGALRVASVRPDGPAAHAGMRAGDRIVLFDGKPPVTHWADALAMRPTETPLLVEIVRATRHLMLSIQLDADRSLQCRITEAPSTPKVTALRNAWLNGPH